MERTLLFLLLLLLPVMTRLLDARSKRWEGGLGLPLLIALSLALALRLELLQAGLPDLYGVSASTWLSHNGHEPCQARRHPYSMQRWG